MDRPSRGAIGLKTIFVKDFSEFPGPRSPSIGPNSGEEFREEILIPAIKQNGVQELSVNLDGTYGYGSSFLEEAFGGLVRKKVIDRDQASLLIANLVSDEDPSLIEEIKSYMLA